MRWATAKWAVKTGLVRGALLLAACVWVSGQAEAVETPSSSGEASRVETPLLRIPMTRTPPTIDGVMSPGEWVDASAASGFWYWNYGTTCHYDYMAPFETQLQVYAAYDKEKLYLAWTSPVYPVNSWLRALGRFPDVISHPLYGIYRDDYVGLGVWPYGDPVKSYRMGQFSWFINCIDVMSDSGPPNGRKWQSGMTTRGEVTRTRWVQEMAIPLKSMVHGPYAGQDETGREIVKLPPPDGTLYLFRLDRCDGERGIRGFHNKFHDGMGRLVLDSQCVSFQVNELGPIMEDIIDVRLTAKNHSARSQTVRLGFFVEAEVGVSSVSIIYADPLRRVCMVCGVDLRVGTRRTSVNWVLRLAHPREVVVRKQEAGVNGHGSTSGVRSQRPGPNGRRRTGATSNIQRSTSNS